MLSDTFYFQNICRFWFSILLIYMLPMVLR